MLFSTVALSALLPLCWGHVSKIFDQDNYPPQNDRPRGPSLRHTNDFVSTFDFHRKFLKNKQDIPHAFHDDDEDDDDEWGKPSATEDSSNPSYEWRAPDLTKQSRAPCPMLNTLANHGMLPRDGKNITADMFADVLKKHLNLERSFWWIVANTTIEVVKPLQTAIDLEDIKMHNGIQHDAALTRNDMGYGEYYTQVNHTLVDQLMALNENGYMTLNAMAKARRLRESQSAAWNPNYTLPGGLNLDPKSNKKFLAIDQAAIPLLVLSDPVPGKAEKSLKVPVDRMKYFFDNERLPFDFGWKRSEFELDRKMVFSGITKLTAKYLWYGFQKIESPTGLHSGPEPNANQRY
jgi:hypothetical protein